MPTKPLISVVLSTYNHPEWLRKSLLGFAQQRFRDFEIVIADDGSETETRRLIQRMTPELPFALNHVWQEDRGFRKTRILNKAIEQAAADYLVFTDGDCIPRADFLAVHVRERRPKRFLSGGYGKLPMALSHALTDEDIESARVFDQEWLRANGMNRRTLKLSRHPRWRQWLLNRLTPTRPRWHGHNASAWRDDLYRVNGFDERMTYGAEDLELGDRLENAGVHGRQIRFSAVCVHLEHERGYVEPGMREANEQLRAKTRQEKLAWTEHGLRQGETKA